MAGERIVGCWVGCRVCTVQCRIRGVLMFIDLYIHSNTVLSPSLLLILEEKKRHKVLILFSVSECVRVIVIVAVSLLGKNSKLMQIYLYNK